MGRGMSLLGKAIVAIWTDIAPEGLDAFYEWHNHEHMPERVGIPGFLRGRRYRAIDAAPAYFKIYEAESTSVLTGPHYVERLNNPTPATRHIIPAYFRNMIGGSIVALRFAAAPGRDDELERHFAGVLRGIATMPMIAGAHLCVADASAS